MTVDVKINNKMKKVDDSGLKEPTTDKEFVPRDNVREITMKQGTNRSDKNAPANNLLNEMKDGSEKPPQSEEIQSTEESITEHATNDTRPYSCQSSDAILSIQKNPSDDMSNDLVVDDACSQETNSHEKPPSSDESFEFHIIKESLKASQKFLSTNSFLMQQQRFFRKQKQEEECEEKKSDLAVITHESTFTTNDVLNSNEDTSESPKDVITAFPVVNSVDNSKSDIQDTATIAKESTMNDLESNIPDENALEDNDPNKNNENITESSTLQVPTTKKIDKTNLFKKIRKANPRIIIALIIVAAGLGTVIFGVMHVLSIKDTQIVRYSNSTTDKDSSSTSSSLPSQNSSSTPSSFSSQNSPSSPSSFPSQVPVHRYPELTFFVLGDIPYNRFQRTLLQQQIQNIKTLQLTGKDSSQFIVHVGDLMSSNNGCSENDYKAINKMFTENSPIPVLTVPGDNEWNDCPNPTEAWERFDKNLIGLEKQWKNNTFHSIVERSTKRSENFAFFQSGILFLGINMVAGKLSQSDSRQRLIDNEQWLNSSIKKYSSESRAIIIFGHSTVGSKIFSTIKDIVEPLQIPMVYINGNIHFYKLSRQFDHPNAPVMSDKFWRVQLDAGAFAPPMRISIKGTDATALSKEFEELSAHQTLIADGLIKLDRIEKISYFSRWS